MFNKFTCLKRIMIYLFEKMVLLWYNIFNFQCLVRRTLIILIEIPISNLIQFNKYFGFNLF
jgi:hypothetical protein